MQQTVSGLFRYFLMIGVITVISQLVSVGVTITYASQGSFISEFETYMFHVERDEDSLVSLSEHLEDIDYVIAEWLNVDYDGKQIVYKEINEKNASRTRAYLKEKGGSTKVLAHVNNFDSWAGERDGRVVSKVLTNADKQQELIDWLIAYVQANDLDGVSIDFENLSAKTRELIPDFLRDLRRGLEKEKGDGVLIVNLPFLNTDVPYEKIEQQVDKTVLMAYDQHRAGSSPGPVSGRYRYQKRLRELVGVMSPEKLVVALAGYGYDRNIYDDAGVTVTLDEIRSLLETYDVMPRYDEMGNMMFRYTDALGDEHEVRYLDSYVAVFQASYAKSLGIKAIGLWRLGSEDPMFRSFAESVSFDPSREHREPVQRALTLIPQLTQEQRFEVRHRLLAMRSKVSTEYSFAMIDYFLGKLLSR